MNKEISYLIGFLTKEQWEDAFYNKELDRDILIAIRQEARDY